MKNYVKSYDGMQYINPDYIIAVEMKPAHKNGRPVDGFQVVAKYTAGTAILFYGDIGECAAFIERGCML